MARNERLRTIERVCTTCGGTGQEISTGDEWEVYLEEACLSCGGAGTVLDHKGLAKNGFRILDGVAS